ncbi:MAG: 2-dehydro-3-deoxy-6-phosphogalactonate aldolase [Acetobacteraceae bacterium]|nr:2-dehydro-3-deoxy-6-phosphogalactonate aldolase [Acetobacteraceae bacterium]
MIRTRLDAAIAQLPLVAILRGVRPEEAVGVARACYEAGFRLIEVPLNSPDPFTSIAAIRADLPHAALVGAGTVLDVPDVLRLAEIHADLVVMPHADLEIIRTAKSEGLICLPGIATPTEAFAALKAGADGLKLFPCELITPAVVKAMRAVLPKSARLFGVGGIGTGNMAPYVAAGLDGFGLGSALYAPGRNAAETGVKAAEFVRAWASISG